MTVRVQLFAGAREAAAADCIGVPLGARATFADLAAALLEACPPLAPLIKNARFASNAEYVTPGDLVDPEAQIALIPPVSGG